MIALLLACSLPVTALAAEYDLAEGSVTVIATESGQTVTHGSNAAVPDDAPVIVQSNSETPTTNTVTVKAEENAAANVIIQGVNIVKDAPLGTVVPSNAAVTVDVADGAEANITLSGVNIDMEKTGGQEVVNPATDCGMRSMGEAAVWIRGSGDVTLELDGENTVKGGNVRAGVEKSDANSSGNLTVTDENGTAGSLYAAGGDYCPGIGGGYESGGSNITVTGSAKVTAQGGLRAAGIGGGYNGSGSNITISGSAEVTAQGGRFGSGIGGGYERTGINITVSGDAQVKAQGGTGNGAGAAIGEGGKNRQDGAEVPPNTDALTANGKIEYYAPGANMSTDDPYKTVIGTYVPPQPEEPAQPARPLYRVIDPDGKTLDYKAERKDGVLTITAEADFAALTGTLGGIRTLKAQGIDTIVFVTNGATSTFALSDLLAQGGDGYTLTHDGAAVTFTMTDGADVSKILQ